MERVHDTFRAILVQLKSQIFNAPIGSHSKARTIGTMNHHYRAGLVRTQRREICKLIAHSGCSVTTRLSACSSVIGWMHAVQSRARHGQRCALHLIGNIGLCVSGTVSSVRQFNMQIFRTQPLCLPSVNTSRPFIHAIPGLVGFGSVP